MYNTQLKHDFFLIAFQDSLWAAEDIEAVFDQDPQRVCILQGPVAVKHAKVKDEPIADMLGGITSKLSDKLLARYYNGDASSVPTVDYLGAPAKVVTAFSGVSVESIGTKTTYSIGSKVPETDLWLESLAGEKLSWLHALIASPTIIQGSSYIDNPLRRVLAPRSGQKAVVESKDGSPLGVTLFGSARSFGKHKEEFKAVEITYAASSRRIKVTLYEDRQDVAVPLHLLFTYRPDMPFAPIHEVAEGRNKRIKEFYWKLWFGDDSSLPVIDVRDTFKGPLVTIDASHVERFCSVVGNNGEVFKTARTDNVQAPMDFAIVTGWQVKIIALVFSTYQLITFVLGNHESYFP